MHSETNKQAKTNKQKLGEQGWEIANVLVISSAQQD